jgi:hypothetical protein
MAAKKSLQGVVCLTHPDTPATARCATCAKPVCDQCAVAAGELLFCSAQCRQNGLDSAAVVSNIMDIKKRGVMRRRLLTLIKFIILAGLVYGGWVFYKRNPDSIDSKVKELDSRVRNIDLDSTVKGSMKQVDKAFDKLDKAVKD